MVRPLWIEVNLGALRRNFRAIKGCLAKNVKIMAIVKQSAYGHGLIPVARELSLLGVDFFGVGSIEEAVELRKNKIKQPILVLTAVLDKFAEDFITYDVIPTVVDFNFAKELNKAARKKNRKASAHVKIDTGMGRLGVYYKDAAALVEKLAGLENIVFEGIYTHFPVADTDSQFTNHQIAIFGDFIRRLNSQGMKFKYLHCANSIAVVNYPDSHFNLVRPGLILYGIKPSPNVNIRVEPVLSLKSKVVFAKTIDKGMGVSYGRAYIADKAVRIATIAAGYADGYPWSLSKDSCVKSGDRPGVIIRNKFFNIAGRVCMDHIMVELGNNRNIKAGEEVILLGKNKNLQITAEDLARWAGTIPYEIVSRLSLKIPRIYK